VGGGLVPRASVFREVKNPLLAAVEVEKVKKIDKRMQVVLVIAENREPCVLMMMMMMIIIIVAFDDGYRYR